MQAVCEALFLLFQVNCFIKKPHEGGGFLGLYREKCQEQINKSAEPKLTYFIISSTHLHRRIFLFPSLPLVAMLPVREKNTREQVSAHSLNTSPERALTLTVYYAFLMLHLLGIMVGQYVNIMPASCVFLNSSFKSHWLCL